MTGFGPGPSREGPLTIASLPWPQLHRHAATMCEGACPSSPCGGLCAVCVAGLGSLGQQHRIDGSPKVQRVWQAGEDWVGLTGWRTIWGSRQTRGPKLRVIAISVRQLRVPWPGVSHAMPCHAMHQQLGMAVAPHSSSWKRGLDSCSQATLATIEAGKLGGCDLVWPPTHQRHIPPDDPCPAEETFKASRPCEAWPPPYQRARARQEPAAARLSARSAIALRKGLATKAGLHEQREVAGERIS